MSQVQTKIFSSIRCVRIAAISLFGAVFFCFCPLVPAKKAAPPPPPPYTAENYLKDATAALDDVVDVRFTDLLNRYSEKFPAETQSLLNAYADKQNKLLDAYLGQPDPGKAFFHYLNLLSVSADARNGIGTFIGRVRPLFVNRGDYAYAKSLAIDMKSAVPSDFAPLPNILDYNSILARITIDRSYRSASKLTRRDFPQTMGSGFLIGPRHVMTAFHVVNHVFETNTISYSIDITLNKKTYVGAKLVGWDSLSDVAVLELPEAVPFPYTAWKLFGDSDRLSQGDPVYCLGFHEAYKTSTLTEGVVGAVKREAPEVGYWVQVDANVAPGASGGLLIGKDRLIYGMIVAGTYLHDINFMIPSNLIMIVLDRLQMGLEVTRPWLGLLLEENPDPAKKEVRVIDVFPSSPLTGVDLKGEPVLVSIDDIPVGTIKKAQDVLMNMNAGNMVKITYNDGKGDKNRWVVLSRRPDYPIYYAVKDNNKFASLYPHFGFDIDRKRGEVIAYSGKVGKVNLFMYTVTRVQPKTFLDSRGVKTGDKVGFIYDFFEDKTRYIQILHIPRNYTLNDIKDWDLFIYTMERSCYDPTIL